MSERVKPKRGDGRPTMPLEKRRTERISFGVTKAQKAAFLVNAAEAGLSSNDYARAVLCAPDARSGVHAVRAPDFATVDALARIGDELARLRFIADETGVVPSGLDAVTARLERQLDHLIVGSRLADELSGYRDRLNALGDQLEASDRMTAKCRGMIRTFDAVVRKVLSA